MKKTFVLLLAILSLVACSSENGDADPTPVERKGAPVSFSIAVPTASATRIADPGSDAGEHDSWDRLLVIVAYTEKKQGTVFPDDDKKRMVYYDTFTKAEFESSTPVEHTNSVLSPDTDGDGYHDFTMYLPVGDCHIYGITYTEGCGFNPVAVLDAIYKDGNDHNADIMSMLITNDYATGRTDQVAQMVSVATGYAVDTSDPTSTHRLMHISLDKANEMKQYWRMTLTRLATKVDIQWDAQSAYEPATSTEGVTYTDVRISQFVFRGGADATTGSGYGRLFPALAAQAAEEAGKTLAPVGGDRTFINTSEISRRNGRVYHYTFPDGTSSKKITFSLVTSTSTDIVKDKPKTSYYTFDLTNLSGGFRRATWYKINVSIVGTKKQDGTVTIIAFN